MRPQVWEIIWMLVPHHAAIVASDIPACRHALMNVCRVAYGEARATDANCGKSAATGSAPSTLAGGRLQNRGYELLDADRL